MTEVQGNFKVAKVKFLYGTNTTKEYAFALFDDTVKVGDFVLTDTITGHNVAEVVGIVDKADYNGVTITKEVICKVDYSAYNKRIENRKAMEKIEKQLDEKLKSSNKLAKYMLLAQTDPSVMALVEQYQSLMNGN